MHSQQSAWVNPWLAIRLSGARIYILVAIAVVAISAFASVLLANWSLVSRSGGVVILFGVLLSLRRLFRLGPQRFDEPSEPVILGQNQFNMRVITQDIQRAADNFAQATGISLIVIGTIIGSYGDLVLDWLVPLGSK